MKRLIIHAKKLLKEKRIKEITPNMFKVDTHIVNIKTKSARKIITCDCENHTRFCNSGAMCRHKFAALYYLIRQPFNRELKILELFYKNARGIAKEIPIDTVREDLKKLK